MFEAYTMIDHIKSEIQCLRDDIGTVAELFLCIQLLSSECFVESNTIFNGQTRDATPDQFESWYDDPPIPRPDGQASLTETI